MLLATELCHGAKAIDATLFYLWTPLQTQAENWLRRVAGCCHLSSLVMQDVLRACLRVRKSNPNQVRVLCFQCNGLVFWPRHADYGGIPSFYRPRCPTTSGDFVAPSLQEPCNFTASRS